MLDPGAEDFAEPFARRPQPAAWLARALVAERERWVLWVPVLLASGIGLYFGLAREPWFWSGPLAVLAAGALAGGLGRWPSLRVGVAAVLCVAIGFAAAQFRTAAVEAPMVERPLHRVAVTGRVAAVDRLASGARLVLDRVTVEGLAPAETPRRIRVRVVGRGSVPPVGATVGLRATLNPPPNPAEPGAFDFRRHAFFEGIGAVGFALGRAEIRAEPDGAAALTFERLRQEVAKRVADRLVGAEAGVATALLTGEQTGVPASAMAAMRDSGLAHLLAISGLHIGLVAGLVMLAVRAALALHERWALRHAIKKWAAVAGMVAAVAYTLLVGAPVPTQRAVLTTGVVLAAILVDRNPLSLRLVAFAATVVLLVQPETLLGPSFQMSFAAVTGLVAVYEGLGPRWRSWRAGAGAARRGTLYLGGVATTSLIATAATAPFSLFHFQQLAVHGLLANVAAVPLTASWIMPCCLVAYLLMPLGLEGWALDALGWGVAAVLWVARTVAGLPGAVLHVGAMPTAALAAVVLGGLWLLLWRTSWRYAGIAVVVAGVALALAEPRPNVLVAEDGRLAAVRLSDGALSLSSRRIDRFSADVWRRRDGGGPPAAWPKTGTLDAGTLACDALGCMYRAAGRTVALARDREALAEDCRTVDLVVAAFPVRRCPAPAVIDVFDLWREGAHAVYVTEGGLRVETVAQRRGVRPWSGGP